MSLPASCPTIRRLEVEDLTAGYTPDLPPVLDGFAFGAVDPRVGVVGRTGAGNPTIPLALFRVLEARWGSILIDEIDISKIKLNDQVSQLAPILHDPVLYSRTNRLNLDRSD